MTGLWVTCLGLAPTPAQGQEGPYAFSIRGGTTLPVGSFRDETEGWEGRAGRGTSLAMGFTFPLFRFVGGYLGFSQHKFGCDENVCPEGNSWVSTGFDVALRVVAGGGMVRPWVQGGVHTHRMEARIHGDAGPLSLNSEGGGGYEVGGGILIKVAERMSLSPGVRYGLGNVPISGHPNLGIRFLVFDLGLVAGF